SRLVIAQPRVLMSAAGRGSGIANALLNRLEKKLIARGCPKIQINVPEDNDMVLGMYERLGYEHADVLSLGKRLIEDEEY
ncbi:GNAT family N-acetyltransferase, partial [Pseudomonas aeruginosa]|uniref:GNAT family N-acetyltransferase n=1 Tax=Pseudomonas aeruginosa TaxID=287 RepID=UPI0031B76688